MEITFTAPTDLTGYDRGLYPVASLLIDIDRNYIKTIRNK